MKTKDWFGYLIACFWTSFAWKLVVIIFFAFIFFMLFIFPSIDKKNITEECSVSAISIDSLSTLGIDVTLWAESKEAFEKLNNVDAESVSLSIHTFALSMFGSMSDLDWSATKQYMKWQGNKTELFTNYGNRFVVIGTYATLQDKLIFSGYLYKY